MKRKEKENGKRKKKKNSEKLVSFVITAMIVFSLMPAFMPIAAASPGVTAFTIAPDTGTAGARAAYDVQLNVTPAWNKLNITIPAGFEAVAPTTTGAEIGRVEFWDDTGKNRTLEFIAGSPPSTQVRVIGYNDTGAPSDGYVGFAIDYNPGGGAEIPSPWKPLDPPYAKLTLPTATANGSLNISLPAGMQLTNATINLSQSLKPMKNPTKAGVYTFTAKADGEPTGKTATVTINPDAPNKWYIGTPEGNTTIGTSIPITINVTDQYGNINETFTNPYNGSIGLTVIMGVVTASIAPDATVELNATNRNTTKMVNISSAARADVEVEVWGGGLTATKETLEYYVGVKTIELMLVKTELYANDTDTATLTAQLKDNGNDVKVSGVPITVSEYTTLGLKFDGLDTVTENTDSEGKATFTVKAGAKAGSATIRATVESGEFAGTQGETGLTLKQAPHAINTGNTISTFNKITAGVDKVITATLKDYNNSEIKNAVDFPIKFNITAGDAKWIENNLKVYEDTSDSIGNVSATLYSTNASTANKINVMISVKNETGGWETVKTILNIDVDADVPEKLKISPKKSVGLTNVNGTKQVFTIQLQDIYGNDNKTATSPVLITTDDEVLGNMTFDTTTVNNNLWCNITTVGGNTTFTYTVNSTVPGTATLTVNVTEFGIIDTITITTTGPTGLNLTVDKKLPLVGDTVTATAQLTALVGGKETDIAIGNIAITFTLWDPNDKLIGYEVKNTDDTGKATYKFSQTTHGTHTITAANATYPGVTDTNTTTYVGNATQIWIAVNNTNPQVNETISVYAIFKDKSGYNSSSVDGDEVSFIAAGAEFAKKAISNGVASATYTTPTTGGTVILYVFYTNATNPYWEGVTPSNSTSITVGPVELKNFSVSIRPSSVVVNLSTSVEVNVTDADTEAAVEGATVSLSGCGVTLSNTTNTTGIATFDVNASSIGTINVTVTKGGYNDGTGEITAKVCPGDFTEDGYVNIDDVVYLVTNLWGPCTPGAEGDFTDDGYVNIDDVVYMVVNLWGPCP